MYFVDPDKFSEDCQKKNYYRNSVVVCISKIEQIKLQLKERQPVSPTNSIGNIQEQGQERLADDEVITGLKVNTNKRSVKLPKISSLNFAYRSTDFGTTPFT